MTVTGLRTELAPSRMHILKSAETFALRSIAESTDEHVSVIALARQSSSDETTVSSTQSTYSLREMQRDRTMTTRSVIDRTTAEIANHVVARLGRLQVPEIERVAFHRDGEWINIWLICSSYPLQDADSIYAIEPELVMAFTDVYISLRVICHHEQDISTLANIPDDSLIHLMVNE